MSHNKDLNTETAFTMDASSIKFGPGVTREVGFDLRELGSKRAMVVVDPNLRNSETLSIALDSLHDEGIDTAVFDQVRVEPTDLSFAEAIDYAVAGRFDGYVAVGGGSTMDTCKVANLYASHPADFLEYVNAPIGKGTPVPGQLAPMIAIPTTAGTGSETTGVAIFDLVSMHVKTGIAHRSLRPRLGLIDPDNTRTLPRMVVACSGLDIFCHALESMTALPYNKRPAPENPRMRPAYQGANPLSNIWAEKAVEIGSKYIRRAMDDTSDDEARGQMILAATMAGIGFGSAGVTLPHGMSYPISGLVRDFVPEGYSKDHPIIPHGMAVTLTAPAAFRFMGPANPDMCLRAARLLGVDTSGAAPSDAGELLAQKVAELLQQVEMPNGLSAVGYTPEDVDKLVEGVLPQHRVTKLSPRPATADDFRQMFLDSMTNW